MVQFERLKMEYIIHWTIWTIILLVKHGTAVTLNQDLSISEGLPANSVVGRLLDNPPYILFDNSKSPVSADLDINTDTGEIRTKIILDRETQDVYTFNAISASSNNIAVTVSVSDVNDYAPKFSKDETIISISESAPRGAKHALGSAIDPDFGNFTTQRYAIVSGNTNDAFSLISRRAADGILYVDLIVSGHLDYDDPATRTYNLLLVAYDGGDPPLSGSTRVIVQLSDSNDNQPIFNQSRYSAKVPENATIGTSVVRVFATDQDGGENGRVEYFIDRARSDADQVFAIDKTSGVVRLNKRLDYETKHGYELIVVARDNATQPLETTAIVSIEVDNINEHPPSIDLVFLTDDRNPKLSEKASPGDYVARISVSDPDVPGFIANINVTLDGGDGHFGLTTQNNVVYLMIVSKPLDRERRPFYRLTIIATDAGVPPLTSRESFNLVVSDTNDNAPKFTADTYEASLAEVSPPGSSVVKVTATDSDFGNNSRITYGIVASAYSAWFRIDATTGLVMSASRLDCETVSRPRITVTATDHGSPPLSSNATVIVTIKDVNDNQPVFDQSYYDTTVDESANVDSCILKVSATDPDCGVNAQVTYSLGTGSGFTRPDEFEIDEKSGQICIKRPLDYERTSVYEFQIVASDADNLYTTAMVKISVLDKNDNRPVFYPTSYSVNLNENGVVGAEVALVSASDADSGDFGSVRYAIVGGNADNLFTIGQTSGLIKLQSSYTSGQQRVHNLQVSATDGAGMKSLVNAVVTISIISSNQGLPTFSSLLFKFSIPEDATPGASVGTVTATQQGNTYSIVSGDPQQMFQIGQTTGIITVAKTLDHDTIPSRLLGIQAQQGNPPRFGRAQANVTISDINDNKPEFSVNSIEIPVKENTPPATKIYQVRATDRDSGQNGMIRYSLTQNPQNMFAIDSITGAVSVQSQMDYEATKRYSVTIRAVDLNPTAPQSASMTLVVAVQDFNDNAPVFAKSSYKATIRESAGLREKFLQVSATDRDYGNNARITYTLRVSADAEWFGVYPNDGSVYVRKLLNQAPKETFALTVQAVDNGQPELSATASITVHVQDDNDHVPTFQADEYTFSVHENRPDMTQVGSVSAVDLDKGQNALIGYKIETKTDLFTINANTGLISTSVRLDREVDSTYVLHVSAADHGSPPKSTTVDVRINVIDENDNVPVFQRPGKYVAKVQENRPKGTLVAQVKANDVDLGVNGEVSYAISSGPSNLFAIHSITGQITTKEVLDFETGGSYQLIVSARDGGTPSRVATIPVEISVLDINENGPLFPSTVVNLNVVEGIPAGTVIGSVRIHGSAAQVKYYIVGGNLLGSFGINSLTGDIYTIREVDYETSSSYSLRVQAVDSNVLNRRSSFLTVNITILDLNDNAPKFEAEKIVLTVPENVGVGYSVNRYQASDKDKSVNGTVRYSIESETPSGGYFKIDAITGVLSTARAIDYENLKEVVLVIAASDNGPVAVRRKTRTTVRVLVDDKNDNAPIFVPHPRVDVMEDEPVDFPVVHVLADDADSGNNGKVTYRIESGNEDSHFKLDYETGLLSIIKLLDYEFKQLYRLRISATDHGSPARSSEQLIEVHVVDVNDHPPHFKQPLYSANVSENVIEGSYVAKIEAVDRDTGSNAELFYFIPNGIADNKFVVGKSTGIVTTAGNIDRETKDSYIITAYVKDGAYPARYDTTTVLVRVTDVNDNTPIFEKQTYYISIPENSAFTDIHTVGAMDKDLGANADITYLIIAGNSEGKFSLDSTTGRLSCSALDREVTPSYSLTIHAKDRGQPSRESTCRINVTVLDKNDNDPTFSRLKYTKVLMEDAPIGTSVTTITTSDNDIGINGAISYTLGNNTNGMFTIDSQTGVVTTVSAFDREKKSFYSFDVTAMDGGQYKSRKKTASVEVTILDVNDNVPIFKTIPYKKTIPQSTPAGGLVLRVEADDLDTGNNGNVVYSLEAENPYFKVDSTTGEIKTKRLLDNAALKVHQMIVIAKDLGSPQLSSKGVVEIQVGNQNVGPSVQFDSPSYTAQIKENSRVGSLVKMVQASYVGGNTANPITYSLASGNEANTFAIDSTQGMITVSNAAQLDYEAHSQIKLTVMAEGSGVSAYAMLTVNLVDKNDNPPKFTQDNYVSSVWEGATRNTFVTQVTAMDPDKGSNGEIVYTIIEGDEDRAFRIDPPYSGIVTTNLILDREIRNSYRLLIEAVDQGYPPRTSTCTLRIMVIDTNDNRPFFPRPPPVDISERTPVGTVITTVTANDVDLSPPLAYDFTSGGNPDNTFTIDKLSGKVTLAKPLDYEKRHQYTLRIQATDTVHPVTTDLVVNVIDENDNAPTFARNSYTISLPENTPSGVAVLNMNASDADSGLNSKLTYSMGVIPVDGFSIDKNTGTIYTNKTVVYNPQQPNYQFVVIVKDRGAPSLTAVAAVNIKIFDRNDEKPIFTKTTYEIHVKENAKKGTNVIQVTAVDADKSRVNSKVDYAITSGNQDEMFQMVSNTGEIVIVGSLDRERVNLYVMEVQGKDRGTPSQTGTSTVKIIIDDVNDWAPKFNKTEYKAKINESVTVGTAIVKVSAHDYDVGENSEIAYAILSGDVAGNFAIDTQTGRVTLAKSVDHEINKQHRLVVQATDCVTCPIERRLSSYCTVVIDVADVNDHKPFFPVLMYIEKVDENKPAGTHVFTAHANDQDAGVYGQLTYELESAQPGLFDINPSTGAVATKKVFDYEDPSGNQFYFKVKAVDNGGNTVPINVEVNIGSVDEYKPSFLKQGYQFSVRGDSKVGDVVGTVRATDADGGEDGRIVYSFRDPQEYFAINGTTGSVYVAKPLSENAKSKRKKRMAPRYERANAQHRHRRAIPQDTVSLLIEASSGKDGSLNDVVMVKVDINRTCQGCGISGPREQTGMLSGTAFVLVIVFPILTIIVIVVVVLLCLCRQRATKRNEPSDTASIQYGNHNGAFDPMPIQGVRHMTPVIKARAERSELVPPSYNELHGYSSTPNMTTSELSDQSHSASSGRGSAEENDDDEEICHINSSPLNQTNSLARKSMPDSGIQQDEDNVSEHSVQNHQEYLARLGIDVSKIGAEPTTKPATTSVESIHQFSEEGGGEGDGLDLGNIIYGKLAECEPDEDLSNISSSQELGFDEVEPSNAGSLSSVINSEEEFSGSYNWDYLLDWGPQYQPLAHVFTEIARLKDESIQPKKLPTQIVPQRPYPTSFNPAKMKNLPPPIITNAPPLAKLSSSSSQQNSPSYSPSSVQSGSAAPPRTVVINPSHVLPRSPITNDVYQSSAYTPSFTPSLSPLATGSPLVSPLNGSQGSISHASSLGGSGQTTPRGRRVINAYPAPRMSTSGSEQELHI